MMSGGIVPIMLGLVHAIFGDFVILTVSGNHPFPNCQMVGIAGSATAVIFGLAVFFWAQIDPDGIIKSGPTGGMAVAIIGVITALASLLIPMMKIWMNERQHEREDRFRRHDLSNKLQAATLQIEMLKKEIEDNRQRLEDQHTLIMKLTRAENARTERESHSGLDIPVFKPPPSTDTDRGNPGGS